jgi:hypothetical protein
MSVRLGILLACACISASAATGDPVCVLSAPVAEASTTVGIDVWFSAPSGAKPEFKWDAPVQRLRTEDGYTEWRWDLTGVQPGGADAGLDIIENGKTKSCGVHLRVVADLNTVERQRGGRGSAGPVSGSGREFIARGPKGFTEPPEAFGLYSYVLFASEPTSDAEKQRHLDFFTQLIPLIKPLRLLEQGGDRRQLNATRIPVGTLPAGDDVTPAWLQKNYDYAGATILLTRSGIPFQGDGMYIVSVTKPLTQQKAQSPYLVIDLSKAPGRIAKTWVNAFLNQATKQDFSDTKNLQYVVADLREIVAITAAAVPQVQQQIGSILKYVP